MNYKFLSKDGEHHSNIETTDEKPEFSFLSGRLLSSSITDDGHGTVNNGGQSVVTKTNTELALPYSGGKLRNALIIQMYIH